MWVAGEFVPRPSNKEGETWTTLKFVAVYADQAACEAAANEAYNREGDDEPAAEAAQDNGQDAAKAMWVPFLPGVWAGAQKAAQANGTDAVAEMGATLASNDSLSPYFTIDSPEVQAVMSA